MKQETIDALHRAEIAIRGIAQTALPHASVYLFGSRANGSAGRRSDFDLAVLPQNGFQERELIEFTQSLEASSEIIYSLDVVDIRDVSEELRQKIEREGKLWKN